jgi:DNA repair protein RadC
MPCASAQGAVQILQALGVDREPAETLGVLYVDQRNRLIGFSLLYRGTINGAACEPRGIFQGALLANAAGIILFHNHPSGDPSPSAEDLCFTRSVAEIGELLRIRLIDHVVIGEGGKFASMKERGW